MTPTRQRMVFIAASSAFVGAAGVAVLARHPNSTSTDLVRVVSTTALSQTAGPEGPPQSLDFAAVASGGGTSADGSIVAIGQPGPGVALNGAYTMDVGAVPTVVVLTTGDGDLNDDGVLNLVDFGLGLSTCFSGSGNDYPGEPFCWRFDMDRDGDVDIDDYARFKAAFDE